jgi:hypothetical protein
MIHESDDLFALIKESSNSAPPCAGIVSDLETASESADYASILQRMSIKDVDGYWPYG